MNQQLGDQRWDHGRHFGRLLVLLWLVCWVKPASAQVSGQVSLSPRVENERLLSQEVLDVELRLEGELWREPFALRTIKKGDRYSPTLVRRVLNELAQSGLFADLSAEVRSENAGVVLIIQATPRRMIQAIFYEGDTDLSDAARRALTNLVLLGSHVVKQEWNEMDTRGIALYQQVCEPEPCFYDLDSYDRQIKQEWLAKRYGV